MVKAVRCALYTRKSSEEGLEQGFNSLHAQREACEAYVLSQIGEGWVALKTAYEDGGFSGGSMERPGLKTLLADIDRGLIDVVVVYKVDRLTRSLSDFVRIVEAFDARGVSFVSVTQAFNTTTSMGRLTLNVLLSFAQFEREVTGERIRDKIAASKAKGMWMGGGVPFGYDVPTDPTTRALVINEAEADTVRAIFSRYLELGSVNALKACLAAEGTRSKVRVTAKGRRMGGGPFDRGALFHLLKSRTYLGEIVHKDRTYPGSHPAIVDDALFARVQALLSLHTRQRRTRPTSVLTMPLKGLLFDADGERMSPTFTHGSKGQVYRYYVSAPLQQGARRPRGDDAIRRVQSDAIETLVQGCLVRLQGPGRAPSEGLRGHAGSSLIRVEVHPTNVQLLIRRAAFFKRPGDPEAELQILNGRLEPAERLVADVADEALVRVTLPRRLRFQGGKVWLTDERGRRTASRCEPDETLIKGLRAAHAHVAACGDVPVGRLEGLLLQNAPDSPYHRNVARLAFLAPDIQALILEGRQPASLTLTRLLKGDVPPAWDDQRRLFDIPC